MASARNVTFAALLASLASVTSVVLIWSCSSFESGTSSSPTNADAQEQDGALPPPNNEAGNSSGGGDGQVPEDSAPPDAGGPRRIECSGLECKGERNEICCVYTDAGVSATNRYGECTIGTSITACVPGQGETAVAFSECDDETDCPSGLVCCHTFNGINGACGTAITAARCRAPGSCLLCGTDGGAAAASRIACDDRKPGNFCPPGYQCLAAAPNAIVARSYCVK